jgi:hypothetical protein
VGDVILEDFPPNNCTVGGGDGVQRSGACFIGESASTNVIGWRHKMSRCTDIVFFLRCLSARAATKSHFYVEETRGRCEGKCFWHVFKTDVELRH